MEFGIPINGFYGIWEKPVSLGFEGQPFIYKFPCREIVRCFLPFSGAGRD
jgi:hypothetical protein